MSWFEVTCGDTPAFEVIYISWAPIKRLSFPKIISGRIDDVARPGTEWLQ
jgi:hypothetical protein